MASEAFFQACQEGNVEKLIEEIESTEGLDIGSKDGYGMTALAYAARNEHTEVVRQLLSRGADRTEVLEQGYGRNNPEIAQLLEEGGEARGVSMGEQGEGEPIMHQGMPSHQMSDGGVYMNGGGGYPQQGYPMMPGYGAPPQGQQYYYDGMHATNGSGRRLSQQQQQQGGHSRKDSSVNMPPPEVARLIPCRFFPNCRYGDKCLFAHPIMAMPATSQSGSPLSPSMSQPPMQPIFYQQVPSAYPYPGPYGAGPHQPFYAPMGPTPGQHQYGMPSHFSQSMIQPHPQQHMHMGPNQHSAPGSEGAAPVNDNESQARTPILGAADQTTPLNGVSPPLQGAKDQPEVEKSQQEAEQVGSLIENERDATATPPQQDVVAPLGSQDQQSENKEDVAGATGEGEQESQDAQGKPVHRRQSFNSFLHHHAIPFQPTLQPGTEVGMMGALQPYPQRVGPKNRRMPGVGHNGFVGNGGKRMFGDRPACTFFASGKCRFGDECRFPHILPDGTDARPMQAQQRQMYAAAQFGAGGGNAAARSVANSAATVNGATSANANNGGVPASTPTGPQAEKKAAVEKQQQQQQQNQSQQEQSQPQQSSQQQQQQVQSGKTTSPSPSVPAAAAPIVRSNPSKTSTQNGSTGPSRGGGGHGGSSSSKQKHASQPAQRVPTVNDFPALAVPSPNLNGTTASTPISPSLHAQATLASNPSNGGNDAPTSPSLVGSSAAAPTKVNFSAILSAPAPVKPRISAEASSSAKSTTGTNDEAETKESEAGDGNVKINGDEKTKSNAKGNSNNKDSNGKIRVKEGKAGKSDSYKNVAASTKPTSTNVTPSEEDDDFQLVNRSRASNKRGTSNPTSTSDGFASQAKAVAA